MALLYHHMICPLSRLARILLEEKSIEFKLELTNFWERPKKISHYSPAFELPIFITDQDMSITGINPLAEFLDEIAPTKNFLGTNFDEKNETRRLFDWFTRKFYQDAVSTLIDEKFLRFYLKLGTPDLAAIRVAKQALNFHLSYLAFLLQERSWVAGEKITRADFAAAAMLSVVDYSGDVDWEKHPRVKEWYVLLKSRPSFRKLLSDKIPGFAPVTHYELLDY